MNELTAYSDFLSEIMSTIQAAQYNAFKAINKFHIGQNFELGKIIVQHQEKYEWGQSIVESLSKDINKTVDGIKGYLRYHKAYSGKGIGKSVG